MLLKNKKFLSKLIAATFLTNSVGLPVTMAMNVGDVSTDENGTTRTIMDIQISPDGTKKTIRTKVCRIAGKADKLSAEEQAKIKEIWVDPLGDRVKKDYVHPNAKNADGSLKSYEELKKQNWKEDYTINEANTIKGYAYKYGLDWVINNGYNVDLRLLKTANGQERPIMHVPCWDLDDPEIGAETPNSRICVDETTEKPNTEEKKEEPKKEETKPAEEIPVQPNTPTDAPAKEEPKPEEVPVNPTNPEPAKNDGGGGGGGNALGGLAGLAALASLFQGPKPPLETVPKPEGEIRVENFTPKSVQQSFFIQSQDTEKYYSKVYTGVPEKGWNGIMQMPKLAEGKKPGDVVKSTVKIVDPKQGKFAEKEFTIGKPFEIFSKETDPPAGTYKAFFNFVFKDGTLSTYIVKFKVEAISATALRVEDETTVAADVEALYGSEAELVQQYARFTDAKVLKALWKNGVCQVTVSGGEVSGRLSSQEEGSGAIGSSSTLEGEAKIHTQNIPESDCKDSVLQGKEISFAKVNTDRTINSEGSMSDEGYITVKDADGKAHAYTGGESANQYALDAWYDDLQTLSNKNGIVWMHVDQPGAKDAGYAGTMIGWDPERQAYIDYTGNVLNPDQVVIASNGIGGINLSTVSVKKDTDGNLVWVTNRNGYDETLDSIGDSISPAPYELFKDSIRWAASGGTDISILDTVADLKAMAHQIRGSIAKTVGDVLGVDTSAYESVSKQRDLLGDFTRGDEAKSLYTRFKGVVTEVADKVTDPSAHTDLTVMGKESGQTSTPLTEPSLTNGISTSIQSGAEPAKDSDKAAESTANNPSKEDK